MVRSLSLRRPWITPTDNFVSAAFCISAPFESVFSEESIGAPYALVQHGAPLRRSYSGRRRVFCICIREPCRVAARTRIAIEDAKPFCSRAWQGDAGLVHGLYPVSRYPDLALLAHAWARNPAYSGCDLGSYFGGIDLCLGSLASRVAEGAADWQRINRIWDRRHRVRIAALATAAVLLTYVVVR